MPVADPSAYGLVRLNEDNSVRGFVEKPARRPDRHEPHLAPAPTCSSARCSTSIPPDRNVSIERDVWPWLVGQGLYGFPSEAYWLDIGTPERYLQGTFDILEGNVRTAVAERLGDTYLSVDDRVEAQGRIVPPALVERECTIAAGAHVGSLVVLGEGVSVGAGATIERSVVLNGAADRPGRRAARLHRRGRRAHRRGHDDRRRRGARRGRHDRGAQRPGPRRASLPRDGDRRRSDHLLRNSRGQRRHMTSPTDELVLDRETIGRFDPTDQLTDVLAIPEHLRDALWKVESAGLDRWDSTDGLVVAGMGGSAIGGQLSPRDPRRPRLAPDPRRARLRPAAVDHARHDRPVRVATRATPRRPWPASRPPGVIGAHRVVVTSGGKLAEMARAEGVPVLPVAGGFQPRAAVAYMTVAVLEVAALCGVSSRMNSEIDVAADHLEDLVEEWGPEGAEDGLAKSLARAAARHRARRSPAPA